MLRRIAGGLLFSSCLLGGVGCMKETPPPAIVAGGPQNVPLQAPSGGGAVQAVRKAVVRTVDLNEMRGLHLFLDGASAETGRLPTADKILELLRIDRDGAKLAKAVTDGDIVLTGKTERESLWAYTPKDAPTIGGIGISSSGTSRMTAEEIKQMLR